MKLVHRGWTPWVGDWVTSGCGRRGLYTLDECSPNEDDLKQKGEGGRWLNSMRVRSGHGLSDSEDEFRQNHGLSPDPRVWRRPPRRTPSHGRRPLRCIAVRSQPPSLHLAGRRNADRTPRTARSPPFGPCRGQDVFILRLSGVDACALLHWQDSVEHAKESLLPRTRIGHMWGQR